MIWLTHNLYFESSSGAVSLCITSHASVSCLITVTFDVLDDEGTIGKHFLFSVDRKDSSIAFPDDAFYWVSGYGAGNSQGLASNDGFLIHTTNKRQTVDIETRRVFSRSDLVPIQRKNDIYVEKCVKKALEFFFLIFEWLDHEILKRKVPWSFALRLTVAEILGMRNFKHFPHSKHRRASEPDWLADKYLDNLWTVHRIEKRLRTFRFQISQSIRSFSIKSMYSLKIKDMLQSSPSYLWGRNALVQSSVVGVDARDIEIRDDIAVDIDVLSNLKTFGVWESFSVEFPGNLGGGISASDAVQENIGSRLKCLFRESLFDLRWLDCRYQLMSVSLVWAIVRVADRRNLKFLGTTTCRHLAVFCFIL